MQHDFEITKEDANTGAGMRNAMNAGMQALATNNSGEFEPALPYPGMWWVSTTDGIVKQRNLANDAWVDKGLIADSFTDAAIQIRLNALDGAWISATLENSWVTHTAGQELMYKKLANGIVLLNGAIKSGTVTAGTTICTLPSGYRPGRITYHPVYGYGGSPRLTISTAGVVSNIEDLLSNTKLAMSISFIAEG